MTGYTGSDHDIYEYYTMKVEHHVGGGRTIRFFIPEDWDEDWGGRGADVIRMLRAEHPVILTCRDWAAAVDALRLWAYYQKHVGKYQSIEGDMAEAARYFSVTVAEKVKAARTPGLGSGNELTVPLTLSEVREIQTALRFCRADPDWCFDESDDLMPGRVRTPAFVRTMDRVQEQIDETDREMKARECNLQLGELDPSREFMDIGETFFC